MRFCTKVIFGYSLIDWTLFYDVKGPEFKPPVIKCEILSVHWSFSNQITAFE